MTLDEAIKHCNEVAEENECIECAAEHMRLAEWLTELKEFREKYADCETCAFSGLPYDAKPCKECKNNNEYKRKG